MELQTLELTNFKCFPQQAVRFSKITLLLGANSSGESSLLHGVLAALQTDQFPITLSTNGAFVNLGDFRAISYRRRTGHNVGLELTFRSEGRDNVTLAGTFARSARTGMPELLAAEIRDPSIGVKIARAERYRAEWTYNAEADPFRTALQKSADLRGFYVALAKLLEQAKKRTKANHTPSPHPPEPPSIDPFAAPPSSGGFAFSTPREFLEKMSHPSYLLLGPHLTGLANSVSALRDSFNYVGSFRLEPQRSYYQVSKGELKVLRDGQNYIEQLAEWQEQTAPQLRSLTKALIQPRLLSALRASQLQNGLFEVKVRLSPSSVPVSLPDVGFGIGQLLPILVADLQLPKGSTLAVSQPEIHLHPSAQAELAEYFVRRSHSAGRQYIIETHSEYFLNRLRLLISRGKLSSDDVSVVYFTNDGTKATGHEIRLLANGRVEGAPEDFFRTYMMDVVNIALAATKG